jgi:HK97 family phage portal protein
VSIYSAVVDAVRRSRRDVFVRQGIPAEGLLGPGFAGVYIDQATAARIVYVHAAWDLLAIGAGLLPVDTFIKDGKRRLEYPRPAWLDQPDPFDPSITTEEHFSQAVVSMASDGNLFTLALPEVADVASVTVLDPQRVECRRVGRDPKYLYRPPEGGLEVFGPDQIVHVSRLRRPGQLRGLSPIEEAAGSLNKLKSADAFGQRVFNNGILMVGAVNVPGPMNKDQMAELREAIEAQYVGSVNQGKFGLFASGAKFEYPSLDLEKLQLLALLNWGRGEVATTYHIPSHLLGDTQPGAVGYASIEQYYIEFTDFGIQPYTQRIDAGYKRLLPDPNAFIRHNLNARIRADIKTRMEAYHNALQDKTKTRDEVRALEDDGPADEAEGVGTVYGGFLETPNNNGPVRITDPLPPGTPPSTIQMPTATK